MSSPIGGFYLSAHQRQKQKLAELDAKVSMVLTLQLIKTSNIEHPLMEIEETIYLGDTYHFTLEGQALNFKSIRLLSGLIQVDIWHDKVHQILMVSDSIPLTSLLADDEKSKVMVLLSSN